MAVPPAGEDLERLASRLALMTSEDGEAENAGRAVGQLARKLGLSGGQLKAIFLAGVRAAGVPLPSPEPDPEAVARLEREAEALRRLLDQSDHALRMADQRIAVLEAENERARDALDRARVTGRVWRVAGVVVLAAGLIGGGLAWFGPPLRWRGPAVPGVAEEGRMATVGRPGTTLLREPDVAAEVVGHLDAGARLPVRRLLWRGFAQWVETEIAGLPAYAPATEIDLR